MATGTPLDLVHNGDLLIISKDDLIAYIADSGTLRGIIIGGPAITLIDLGVPTTVELSATAIEGNSVLALGDAAVQIMGAVTISSGDPGGSAPSIGGVIGDLYVDTNISNSPVFWRCISAGVADAATWVPVVLPTGCVNLQVNNATHFATYAQANIVPGFIDGLTTGYIPSAFPYDKDWLPLNSLVASDQIQVALSQTLSNLLWDGVDFTGNIVVWDQAGANLLSATFAGGPITEASSPVAAVPLTQTQLIGTDLSLVGGDSIESAAGGSYNVLINATASWD